MVQVHERQIMNFANLDYDRLNIARERLKQIHTERWQSEKSKPAIQTELPRLNREVNKKKKQHLSIRKLLSDTTKGVPNLVKALKPCWMMSPLSVSQYINPNVTHFDVVIFDEASQLRTEDIISSIIRSDRVVVIGDRKQLPPTSFFSTGDSEEDPDDEDDASYKSILVSVYT
jgi:superfamily I DNA and/or RNA helicase